MTGVDSRSLRTIRAAANMPRRPHGNGFEVAFLHSERIDGGMDPYLQIDAFALSEPFFGPHPHAGFSAVTYILPESPIGFINRDSLGTRNRIEPGALHWTMAGSGMMHEEIPEHRGTTVFGLQMFINLPIAKKQTTPGFFHLSAGEIPERSINGALVRAVVGESNGISSPLASPTPGVRLIDVTLGPDSIFEQELDAGENAFVWLFSGSAIAETGVGDTPLATFDLVGYERGGRLARLRASADGARLVLFAGPPLGEPVFSRGPFVMSTVAELDAVYEAFKAGRMGALSRSRYDDEGRPVVMSSW